MRGQAHTSVACPRCDSVELDEPAYAELLGWYLGDGWIENGPRDNVTLHVYNDAKYVELNRRIAELMARVKPLGRPHTRLVPGCVITSVAWKHWPCLFPQHGPGRKHERTLPMESWQWEIVIAEPAAFLRGLFHSDGARVHNWATRPVAGQLKRYDYPRWQFVNRSDQILAWCEQALDLLEIPWRRSNRWTVSVSRREAVARLDDLIGLKT
jgi:hypothetical protein